MPIDPVKIPQNVYVEDRIIGSVTLRQIIICLISGAASYAIFSAVKAAGALSLVTAVFAWTPLAFGAAFAFVKINGISLTRFFLLLLEQMERPPVRRWAPRRGITISISTGTIKSDEQPAHQQASPLPERHDEKNDRFRALSAVLDHGPDVEGMEEMEKRVEQEDAKDTLELLLPVDRSRVRADGAQTTNPMIDGIVETPPRKQPDARLLRDITPPSLS